MSFRSPGLALRKISECVETELQTWRRAHGVEKAWAATDRLLVCIGASPYSANLVRVGRRMAASLRADWYAVNVETPVKMGLGPLDRARISQNLRLAEQLGAETVTLTGERQAEEILRFARERNVTKIVVGKPRVLRLRDRLGTSFVDELLFGSGDIDVYATVGEPEGSKPETEEEPPNSRSSDRSGYVAAAVVVAMASGLAFLLFGRDHPANVVMTYLLGIVLVATRYGFRPSVLGSVLSVLVFDSFSARRSSRSPSSISTTASRSPSCSSSRSSSRSSRSECAIGSRWLAGASDGPRCSSR